MDLRKREQRLVPLAVGVTGMAVTIGLLFALHGPRVLITTIINLLVIGVIMLGVTMAWKISLHVAALVSSVTMLAILFGPLAVTLVPVAIVLAWARLQLRAHTPAQGMVAAAIAATVTALVFSVADIH
jgi:hypothetical protein